MSRPEQGIKQLHASLDGEKAAQFSPDVVMAGYQAEATYMIARALDRLADVLEILKEEKDERDSATDAGPGNASPDV